VLDVGRKYFTEGDDVADNSCPPKILLIDVDSKSTLSTYVFPASVAPQDGSFLNDLVLDLHHRIAFVASTGNNVSDLGALVVYDQQRQASRRFEDVTTHAATDTQDIRPIKIHGKDCGFLSTFTADGIALSPSLDRLYWSTLGGYHLYSVSTESLRRLDTSDDEVAKTILDHGLKPDISDGMTFGSNGDLFFGGIETNRLYRWTPGTPLNASFVVADDAEKLWWIDTLAWDGNGSIWATSNKAEMWFYHMMDFSGKSGPNFRIVKMQVGTNSYMEGEHRVAV